jgi:hypothetical protein
MSDSSSATATLQLTANGRSRSVLLRLSGLSWLSSQTPGDRRVVVALIDGAPQVDHSCLREADIALVTLACYEADSGAVAHATFLASMLVGQGAVALGLCRNCKLLAVAAIDAPLLEGKLPVRAIAARLADAVTTAVERGADVILLPLDFAPGPEAEWSRLVVALREAACRGIRTIIPAGNAAGAASSILSVPGVVPVTASERLAVPSRWGAAIARCGIAAPAHGIPGADSRGGGYTARSGSSFAAGFVAAAFALLASHLPNASREALWWVLVDLSLGARAIGRIPVLDADRAYERLSSIHP